MGGAAALEHVADVRDGEALVPKPPACVVGEVDVHGAMIKAKGQDTPKDTPARVLLMVVD